MVSRHTLSDAEQRQAAPHPVQSVETRLPLALFAAPLGWSLHLVVSYGLVYPAERWQSKAALYVVTVASLSSCLVSLLLGLRGLQHEARRPPAHFLFVGACVLGSFFFLATLAQCIPLNLLPLGRR